MVVSTEVVSKTVFSSEYVIKVFGKKKKERIKLFGFKFLPGFQRFLFLLLLRELLRRTPFPL
jgi:hypothetical protein